jgi:CRP/FNR family transcriptional regulator, anaerobic regulatory protein
LLYIEAVENGEMLTITSEQFEHLTLTIPAFAGMLDVVIPQDIFANNKRMLASISLTAEERYEDLCRTYPEFLQRFSQGMIASYLGVSGETLSRLKKGVFKSSTD